ncbi:MAG TPA: CHAT domain-containing protein [Longimicrobium sp.]|nr:CHAT domain-containing protein [Longimicrobium sp.]
MDQLAALVAHTGTRVAPRLTISPATLPDSDAAASRELTGLAGRIKAAISAGRADAQTLHAVGLVTLMWADPANPADTDSAIAYLQSALRVAGPDPAILADLAAAHLVRAAHPGAERHLLLALDAADSALALDPRNPTARYALASAFDHLWLGEEAVQAWSRFVDTEPGTEWSRRARERLHDLRALPRPLPHPAQGVPDEWRRLAERDPQRARMLVMDTILPEWGYAVLRGEGSTARTRLASAATVASELARRGGDPSVAEMVAAIRRMERDARATRTLAAAHAHYGHGQALLDGRRAEALGEFRWAEAHATASPALREWAGFSAGTAFFYNDAADSALAAFRTTVARNDPVRFPVLVARAHWSIGTSLLRRSEYPAALREYDTAYALLVRAGEQEYVGAIHGLRFETLFSTGDPDAAYGEMVRALRILSRYRGSTYLHNTLYVAAQACRIEGMSRSARRLEDFEVDASALINPAVQAEALLMRARARAATGETSAAARDAARARALMNRLPAEFQRSWIENDLLLVNAQVRAWSDPAAAATTLDSAVGFYARRGIAIRLLPALVLRADTRLHAGDTEGAVADLDSAASVIGALGSSVESASVRAQMLETGRALYDRLAMVHARAHRPADALRALERGRVSFGAAADARGSFVLAAPSGETVLEYALVGDTLLAFALTGNKLHMAVRPVYAETLARDISALRTALETGAPAEAVRGRLARLHAVLVEPLRGHVPAGARLVIVADGELAAVPFSGLVTRGGGYLVQEHELRVAPSIAQARQAAPASVPGRAAVFVADPALSPADQVYFPPLTLLEQATRDIAGRVPGSMLLEGPAASAAAVRAALPRAALFHFSGHAVFDDARPGRSYLLLAPDTAGPGRLTADQIAGLDLTGVRLVVLAACETQSSVSGRSGGFAGLSGAMLAKGATGVLGSLWHVSEAPSAELIREFYRAYTPGGDGPGALRQAQRRMIESRDPSLSSPSAWAGFRFAGR